MLLSYREQKEAGQLKHCWESGLLSNCMFGDCIPSSFCLHVEVCLSKTLNPKYLSMCGYVEEKSAEIIKSTFFRLTFLKTETLQLSELPEDVPVTLLVVYVSSCPYILYVMVLSCFFCVLYMVLNCFCYCYKDFFFKVQSCSLTVFLSHDCAVQYLFIYTSV